MTCKSRKHIFRCCQTNSNMECIWTYLSQQMKLKKLHKSLKTDIFLKFEFHHFILFRTWRRKEQYLEKSVGKSHALISLSLFSYSSTIIFFKKTYFGPSNDKNIFFLADFRFQNFAFRTWRRKVFGKWRRLLAYLSA